jgi:hypothetical protein
LLRTERRPGRLQIAHYLITQRCPHLCDYSRAEKEIETEPM